MRKRLLMIADADALWTKRYIENLLLPAGFEVTLFPIWGCEGQFDAFYRANGVTVYRDAHKLPVIRHIPRLRMWARVRLNARGLRALGPFDVVHNHYLSQRDLALGWLVKRACGARWACSFWGSDLMRAPARELRRMRPYLERCDAVTVHNAAHLRALAERCGQAVAQKTTLLYFGQTGYAAIDRARARYSRAECKAHFGIDPASSVLCIGYSASPCQQHLPALEALARAGLPQGVTLVLQMSYGAADDGYRARVRERAESLGCPVVVLADFMDDDESAMLRLCADVFVQSITTDAFSASMQEYLYAGAAVLVGAWLCYPQLEELGVEPAAFADFDALPALAARALAGGVAPVPPEKRALLPARYSWDAVRESWMRLYR